jgi:hypothetical protein
MCRSEVKLDLPQDPGVERFIGVAHVCQYCASRFAQRYIKAVNDSIGDTLRAAREVAMKGETK